jgi:hypothetical protein
MTMSTSNVAADECSGAATDALSAVPTDPTAATDSGVMKSQSTIVNSSLQCSVPSNTCALTAPPPAVAGTIFPNLERQLCALGAAGVCGGGNSNIPVGGAQNNWEAYMSIAQQIFPNLFPAANPSLVMQQQQQLLQQNQTISVPSQKQQYDQSNPLEQLVSASARALPPFPAAFSGGTYKQPHPQLLSLPLPSVSDIPTSAAAFAALSTGALPILSLAGQQSVVPPSSTGEGSTNPNNNTQNLTEQSYQQPHLSHTAMGTSPSATTLPNKESAATRVVSSADSAATFNFFLMQQQQQKQQVGASPSSFNNQQLTGPLANAPWPLKAGVILSEQNPSLDKSSTDEQPQADYENNNNSRKRSLPSKGYSSGTDVSSASDECYAVREGKKKSRNAASCQDSSMTASISSSATKNVELDPTVNTAVIKVGVESADFRRYERNAREQHRSQRIAQQIKDLQVILNQSKIILKPTKFSVLKGVKDYVEKLRVTAAQLDDEAQKLRDVIAYATHIAKVSAQQKGIPCPTFHNFSNDAFQQQSQWQQNLYPTAGPSGSTDRSSAVPSKTQTAGNGSNPQDIDDLYQAIFYESHIAMGVASLDGTFIDCNAEFERLSRTSKAEIVTQSLFHFIKSADMANLFKSMGQMLKSCANSSDSTAPSEDQHVFVWSGTTYLQRISSLNPNNNSLDNGATDVQLLLSISLIKSPSGSPKFFHCVLSPILASYMTG